jgi:hypothetical protein
MIAGILAAQAALTAGRGEPYESGVLVDDRADPWFAEHPPCGGCPHAPYTHAHQRWRQPGAKTHADLPDPWLAPAFKAAHPGLGRGALALAWLVETFGDHDVVLVQHLAAALRAADQ